MAFLKVSLLDPYDDLERHKILIAPCPTIGGEGLSCRPIDTVVIRMAHVQVCNYS